MQTRNAIIAALTLTVIAILVIGTAILGYRALVSGDISATGFGTLPTATPGDPRTLPTVAPTPAPTPTLAPTATATASVAPR